MGLPLLQIYGDSPVIKNWVNNKATLSSMELNHWCDSIKHLITCFTCLDIRHVYREHNQSADCLSKDALGLVAGLCSFSEFYDGFISMSGYLQLF